MFKIGEQNKTDYSLQTIGRNVCRIMRGRTVERRENLSLALFYHRKDVNNAILAIQKVVSTGKNLNVKRAGFVIYIN